jgi:uncharacterized protein (TIGR00251 family)
LAIGRSASSTPRAEGDNPGVLGFLAAHPEGVVVEVWVTPRASRAGVGGTHSGALRVRTPVPPESGRANQAVIDLLVARFGGRSGELLSGAASRRKRVLIRGTTPADIETALSGD